MAAVARKGIRFCRYKLLQAVIHSVRWASVSSTWSVYHSTLLNRPLHVTLVLRRNASTHQQDDLTRALSDAEKLVGYPASFLSLRCLLSDEISSIAMYMKRFAMSKHPLMKTARGFVFDEHNTMQTRGLLVLLISKAARPCLLHDLNTDQEIVAGICTSQRQLAEITETIYTANLVHSGVVNLSNVSSGNNYQLDDMEFGNKMAVLSGDFLLANACTGLAELKDTAVVQMISEVIGHLMEGEFMKMMFNTDNLSLAFWNELLFKGKGSLIANSCKAALKIVAHSTQLQEGAFQFGQNVAYAHQLREDLQNIEERKTPLALCSAPVMLSGDLPEVKELLIASLSEESADKQNQLCKELMDRIVNAGTVGRIQELCASYGKRALDSLELFPDCEAKQALVNIVNSCTCPGRVGH